jgi:acetolactate synthase-1/2/3 large subunit
VIIRASSGSTRSWIAARDGFFGHTNRRLGSATLRNRMTSPAERAPTIHEHLVDYIVALGVTTVFGIPGAPLTGLYAALARRNIRTVLARHETGAVFMADGHARITGRPAVCCVTSGPGVLNAATGIGVANSDGVPVLLLSAEVPARCWGRGALQESGPFALDGVEVLRPITALSVRVPAAGALRPVLIKAHACLTSGRRGAVHIAIPSDVGSAELDDTFTRSLDLPPPPPPPAEQVAAILERLPRGKTVIIAGHGVSASASGPAVLALAEQLDARVFTTPKGKGAVREDHPRFAGVIGFGGSPKAWERLTAPGISAVLVLGSSLGDQQTNGWSTDWRVGRTLVHVDIDPGRIGRAFAVDVGLVADVGAFCAVALGGRVVAPATTRPLAHEPAARRDAPMTGVAIARMLSALGPTDAQVFVDVGNMTACMLQHFEVSHTRRFFANLGAGCMGHSVGAAVGAAMAMRTSGRASRTFAVVGDAAFAMYGAEIHVAAELQLSTTVIVANDAGHGMIADGETLLGGIVSPVRFERQIDFVALAKGFGVPARRVSTPDELADALLSPIEGPCLIDVHVVPGEVCEALRARARHVKAMIAKAQAAR